MKKILLVIGCLVAAVAGGVGYSSHQKNQQEIAARNASIISAYESGDAQEALDIIHNNDMSISDVGEIGLDYYAIYAEVSFYNWYEMALLSEKDSTTTFIAKGDYINVLEGWLNQKDKLEQSPNYESLCRISKEIIQTLVDDYQTDPIAYFEEQRASGSDYDNIDEEEFQAGIQFLRELAPDDIEEDLEESKENAYLEAHPFEISNIECYRDGDYQRFEATISNVSKSTRSCVKIKVTYYDISGDMLTSDTTYAVGVDGLVSGGNQQFNMMTRVKGTVCKYAYEVISYQ